MNTKSKKPFKISARNIGPIISLKAELTHRDRNLIFARNGTGKSFISRAFRYLDLARQDEGITDAAEMLVSDESNDGTGVFSFSQDGGDVLGKLELAKKENTVLQIRTDTRFHVFSEDFVDAELRVPKYKMGGEIDNKISVDSENIKIKAAEADLKEAQKKVDDKKKSLEDTFNHENKNKLTPLKINGRLAEYKDLSVDNLLEEFSQKPDLPEPSLTGIQKDLETLKDIPDDLEYPETLDPIDNNDFNLESLEASLHKITSPSQVAEKIKEDIDANHQFYKTGVEIIKGDRLTECPLCKQGITSADPKAVIDTYIAYFKDDEEKHKSDLRELSEKLDLRKTELNKTEKQLLSQRDKYDALKSYFPSRKDTKIDTGQTAIKNIEDAIELLKVAIEKKAETLHEPDSLPSGNLTSHIGEINKIIRGNNAKVFKLKEVVRKRDDERIKLQRSACTAFKQEFAYSNWQDIDALRQHEKESKSKKVKLKDLEESSPSTDARDRVAETFKLLLKEFFKDKYKFEEKEFVLKRGKYDMSRGVRHTLSDGEKTAIAFCYFIACIHRKVTSDKDYKELFLVLDDPVTSMSYDFVFSIAQTLKNLSISNKGEISINPSKISDNSDNSGNKRPKLLILTHNNYFFNILHSNNVVKKDATFYLSCSGQEHKLKSSASYLAPFAQQLEHVYNVSKDKQNSDYSTGNAIRSVLEAVGRFCYPDKSKSLNSFLQFLSKINPTFTFKSALINSLSHGTYEEETSPPDDLKLACEETIKVVKQFAPGQIEVLEKPENKEKSIA